jgi:hypothetical protein
MEVSFMDKNQSNTRLEVSKPLPFATEGDKILCKDCGKSGSIEESTDIDYLIVLLEEAIAPIKSLASIIEDADPDMFNVLSPLVQRLNSDIMKLGAVIVNTLGEVKILVCNHPYMKVDGRDYYAGDFIEAILETKEAPRPAKLQ